MYHGFVDGVGCLVGKNAGGETRDDFFHAKLVADVENIVVHFHIFSEEIQIGSHVVEKSSNLKSLEIQLVKFKSFNLANMYHCSQVNHMSRTVLLENAPDSLDFKEVGILGRKENPVFVGLLATFVYHSFDGFSNEAGAAGNQNNLEKSPMSLRKV